MKNESTRRLGVDTEDRVKVGFEALPTAPSLDDIYIALKKNTLVASPNVKSLFEKTFEIGRGTFAVEQFTFGKLPYKIISDAQRDGLAFVEANLFQLPYPTCLYRASFVYPTGEVTGFTLLNVAPREGNPKERGIATVMFTHSHDYVVATHSINMLDVKTLSDGSKACQMQLPAEEFSFWKETMQTATGTPKQEDIAEGSMAMLGLTMILNTKGIRKERFEPPRKPNIARARAGRPMLPYSTRVYTDVYLRAAADGPKGTHASPRPHLRRAHVRHYKNDHREWYTKVDAMLVNYDGTPLQRGQYEVK